jgi:hypothetical protein
MSDLDFMEVLKIWERFVAGAIEQVEIMGKAACAMVRIQDEMQEEIDRALLRPPAASKAERDARRLACLESFEPEGGVRAQVEVVAREWACESETRPVQRALEALLLLLPSPTGGAVKMPWQQLWEQVLLFVEIAKKAENVLLRCAVTMDRTSATTRLVPKDRQRATPGVRAADDARGADAGGVGGPPPGGSAARRVASGDPQLRRHQAWTHFVVVAFVWAKPLHAGGQLGAVRGAPSSSSSPPALPGLLHFLFLGC